MAEFEDFQEVDNCGGKYVITVVEKDGGLEVTNGYSTTSGRSSIYGVHVLYPQGLPVKVFCLGGIGQEYNPPAPHESCFQVFMISDREEFFGRVCPECDKYFRSQSPTVFEPTTCPYCGFFADAHYFLTSGHREFIKEQTKAYAQAIEERRSIIIDLDELAKNTMPNRPPHYFYEVRQQTRFTCTDCNVTSDIMGVYGYCPQCGYRNSYAIFSQMIDQLEERVKKPRYTKEQRELRKAEWREIVKQAVSTFEGFARDLLNAMLDRGYFYPSRREEIKKISFHNPILAAQEIQAFFGFNLLEGFSEEEQDFLRIRFFRRHIYEHISGLADAKYIKESGDTTVKLGHLVHERSSNVLTLITLVRKLGSNFDKGFHEMK